MNYTAQAQEAIKGIKQLNIIADAVTAKETGDMNGLAYIVGMALKTRDPIKWGLLFAVSDLLEIAWTLNTTKENKPWQTIKLTR